MSDVSRAPFQFGLRALFWSVLSVSIGLGVFVFVRKHPEPGCNPIAEWKILVSEAIALGLVIGMIRDWRDPSPRRTVVGSLRVVALHLYVPFSWLILLDYPWSEYHLSWLKMWPVLPGILPEAIWFHHVDQPYLVMGIVMAALLVGLTWLGTCGRVGRLAAGTLALAISVPSAWVAYGLFRF
jgi:hypothetical protein